MPWTECSSNISFVKTGRQKCNQNRCFYRWVYACGVRWKESCFFFSNVLALRHQEEFFERLQCVCPFRKTRGTVKIGYIRQVRTLNTHTSKEFVVAQNSILDKSIQPLSINITIVSFCSLNQLVPSFHLCSRRKHLIMAPIEFSRIPEGTNGFPERTTVGKRFEILF